MAVNPRIAARTSLLRAGQFLLKTLWHATARKKRPTKAQSAYISSRKRWWLKWLVLTIPGK